MASLNDLIYDALVDDYGPADLTTLLGRWMEDVGIPLWSTDALRTYLLDETGAATTLSTNDLLILYFDGSFDTGGFRELEDGDLRLLETGDFLLLEG